MFQRLAQLPRGLVWVLAIGLAARLILAPYTQFSHVTERINSADHVFLLGFNPLINDSGVGSGFLVFFVPPYLAYVVLSSIGIHFQFILELLFKLPPIAGDVISSLSLYRLAQMGTGNAMKSSLVASLYFLNPYVINISAVVGAYESLMVAFILQAVVLLFSQHERRSAMFLSLAAFMRYTPFLLVPIFVVSAWNSSRKSAVSFLAFFSIFSLLLSLPYLAFLVPLYRASPNALSNWIRYFFGAGGSSPGGIAWPVWQFKWNLTGFLIITGLVSSVSSTFLNLRTFLIAYGVLTMVILVRFKPSVKNVNAYLLSFFLLVLLIFPLSQYHYLVWVLPFALLASVAFLQFRQVYIHIIWISYMVIDLVVQGAFLGYLDYTFPTVFSQSLRQYWSTSIYNVPLQHSIGTLIWFLMLALFLGSTAGLVRLHHRRTGPGWIGRKILPVTLHIKRKEFLLSNKLLLLLSVSIIGFSFEAELANQIALTELFLAYAFSLTIIAAYRGRRIEQGTHETHVTTPLTVVLQAARRMPRKVFIAVFLIALALSFVPLAVASYDGFVPNSRDYSSFGDSYQSAIVSTSSNVASTPMGTLLGANGDAGAWATWRLYSISSFFAGTAMRRSLKADLLITGVPLSRTGSYTDAFVSEGLAVQPYNWHITGGTGTFQPNGTVIVSENGGFVSISSDPGRWFASNNVSTIRLTVSASINAGWSLSVFGDNQWWPLNDIETGTHVHESAGVFSFYVPPIQQFRYPSLFVESQTNTVPAIVTFNEIEYQSLLNVGTAQVSLGSQIVFERQLNYESQRIFHLPPDSGGPNSVRLPVDANLLQLETMLNITVTKNTAWLVQGVTLSLSALISAGFAIQFTLLSMILVGLFAIFVLVETRVFYQIRSMKDDLDEG